MIAEPVGAPTETCDLGNALRRDGLSAGLDRKNDMMGPLIKGFEVSSCLQVDFGAPRAAKIRDRSREADGESLRHELPAFELRDGRRYVAVCRSNGGTMRDDIAVDVVELCD